MVYLLPRLRVAGSMVVSSMYLLLVDPRILHRGVLDAMLVLVPGVPPGGP